MPTYRPPADNRGPAGELARSHLALRSGQPQAVWATLRQLWNHQASPGLYTWDAPRPTTDDLADGWQFARGWHNESVISPDYETAALLLQLQQDMLAYVDEETAEPTVVIGAGVIPVWLSQPMAVSGLALPGGSIDWQWDGHCDARHSARTLSLDSIGHSLSRRHRAHRRAVSCRLAESDFFLRAV